MKSKAGDKTMNDMNDMKDMKDMTTEEILNCIDDAARRVSEASRSGDYDEYYLASDIYSQCRLELIKRNSFS